MTDRHTSDRRASWMRPGWLVRLATLSEPPRRTAAAFALGVFLSFSPLLGLQIAAGLGLSFALRLNRAAVLTGLCTNLPWLMVPWYAMTTAAGAAALRMPIAADTAARVRQTLEVPVYRAAFWDRAADLLSPLLAAFLLGSTVGAALVAVVAYVATLRLITRTRHG